MTTTQPADKHRRAARAVALHAPGDLAARRELLDALGLLDDTGRDVVPEPERPSVATDLSELNGPAFAYAGGERDSGQWQDDRVRPCDLSLVPPGLRDYVPTGELPVPQTRGRGRRGAVVRRSSVA